MIEERPQSGEKVILVHLHLRAASEDLAEFDELARSAGAQVMAVLTGSRITPDAKYFIGSGKLQELQQLVEHYQADTVLINHPLSPSQERNLESALKVRVVDRNGLILDIFAQRARSFEGKLQVELAQLTHLSTRLVRGWTHLERQKGGIGLRGPGETQLETDRRLIGVRIALIKRRLQKVDKQRAQNRNHRQKSATPSVSLIGYTNAGKSTLFNQLTGAHTYVANQLFATLDPTLRQCLLTEGSQIVLADTVGFIRHLPHELVAAFRSTLQETCEAQLLLHVIDASAEDREDKIDQVNQVIQEIGADSVAQLQIMNKIDKLETMSPRIDRDDQGKAIRVWLSAATGLGLNELLSVLGEYCATDKIQVNCRLSSEHKQLYAQLAYLGEIVSETFNPDGSRELTVQLAKKHLGLLKTANVLI